MKSFIPLLITGFSALTSTVYAQSNDLTTITDALNGVTTQTQAIESAANGFSTTDSGSQEDLITSLNDLVNRLKTATSDINGAGVLDQTQSQQIAGPLNSLVTATQNALTASTAIQAQVSSAGLAQSTYNLLSELQTATSAFTTALIGKVDTSAKGDTQDSADKTDDEYANAVDTYAQYANSPETTTTEPTYPDNTSTTVDSEPTNTDDAETTTDDFEPTATATDTRPSTTATTTDANGALPVATGGRTIDGPSFTVIANPPSNVTCHRCDAAAAAAAAAAGGNAAGNAAGTGRGPVATGVVAYTGGASAMAAQLGAVAIGLFAVLL